jgi:hypothetical protein
MPGHTQAPSKEKKYFLAEYPDYTMQSQSKFEGNGAHCLKIEVTFGGTLPHNKYYSGLRTQDCQGAVMRQGSRRNNPTTLSESWGRVLDEFVSITGYHR